MNQQTDIPAETGIAVVGGPAGDPGSDLDVSGPKSTAAAVARKREPGAARRLLWRGPGQGGARTVGGPKVARQGRWLVPVLLIITALSVVLAIGFGIAWSGLNAQQQTRTTVRKVATAFLHDLTSFNPTNLDSRLSTLQTFATGDFSKQANQFFGTSIRQALEQVQASSEGQVRYIYVQSLNGDNATVYAWVDETFTNDKLSGNQTDVLQVVLSMLDTSRGWKISEVSVLNSPSPTGGS